MGELIDKILSYNAQLQGLLLNIIIAILIVLAGFIVGKLVSRLVRRALHEAEIDNILSRTGAKITLEKKLSATLEYAIYAAAIIIAVDRLGIATTMLQIVLFGMIMLILLVAFVSLKDFIPNAAAGFFVFKKKLLHKGDIIEVHGIKGKIENIGLVETEIRTGNNEKVYIPNSTFLRSELKIKKRKAKN
jgi:small conductance mechanosensitive channel